MVRIFTFSLLLAAFNSMAFAGFISVDVHKVDGVYRKTGPHSCLLYTSDAADE